MAVTNETLSSQMNGLDGKIDDFIGEQRRCNDGQQRRLRVLETEQARQDERLTSLRNVFGGIQLMFTGLLAWIGSR